jgi:hypothetical protein
MDLPGASLADVALKTLADDIEAAIRDGRAELKQAMLAAGIKTLSARLPDGTEVATLTLAGGGTAARVADPGKFLAWVQETHPSETEVIVRPGYAEQLLRHMTAAGRAVDPGTGEVVPGIEFRQGEPYITPSFARGARPGRDLIRKAWRERSIDPLAGLRELAAGEAPDAS